MLEPRGRRSIRKRGFNYSSAGAYFVTLCVHNMGCILGRIHNGQVRLSRVGSMVARIWDDLDRLQNVELGRWIVMPNHLHGIVRFLRPMPNGRGLSAIIGQFKSITSNEYWNRVNEAGWPLLHGGLWQRGYWDRIIRDEDEDWRIHEYIRLNPLRWREDPHHPRSTSRDDPHAEWS